MKKKEFIITTEKLLAYKMRKHVRTMTSQAIKKGDLIRSSFCELCLESKDSIQAHHKDYGRPLDVVWLCNSCHGKAHRKGHPLNPDCNPQTPMPYLYEKFNSIPLSFNISLQNFLALKEAADEQKISVQKLLQNLAFDSYPIQKNQLEFKFMEDYGKPLKKPLIGIQSVVKDEKLLQKPKSTNLQEPRSEGNQLLRGVGELSQILGGHGAAAS